MAFLNNALQVEQPLGTTQEGFLAAGGLVLLLQSLLAGEPLHVHLEKGTGEWAPRRAWNICLEKGIGGVGATGCLRYCYQRFGEPWEGERAWNICLKKGTGELLPRGAYGIATNISGSPRKGNVLGIFA